MDNIKSVSSCLLDMLSSYSVKTYLNGDIVFYNDTGTVCIHYFRGGFKELRYSVARVSEEFVIKRIESILGIDLRNKDSDSVVGNLFPTSLVNKAVKEVFEKHFALTCAVSYLNETYSLERINGAVNYR